MATHLQGPDLSSMLAHCSHSVLPQRLISSPAVAGAAASYPQMQTKSISLSHFPVSRILPTLFSNFFPCLQRSVRFLDLKCKRKSRGHRLHPQIKLNFRILAKVTSVGSSSKNLRSSSGDQVSHGN